DLEEDVALFDLLAFDEVHFLEVPGNAGADVDRLERLGAARAFFIVDDVFPLGCAHENFGRLWWRHSAWPAAIFAGAASGKTARRQHNKRGANGKKPVHEGFSKGAAKRN